MTTISDIFKSHGGVTRIAEKLGAPVVTVSAWGQRNRVPAERVLEIERAVGISRHILRPDIYPPAEEGPAHERAY